MVFIAVPGIVLALYAGGRPVNERPTRTSSSSISKCRGVRVRKVRVFVPRLMDCQTRCDGFVTACIRVVSTDGSRR
jgi:hypothetical protein